MSSFLEQENCSIHNQTWLSMLPNKLCQQQLIMYQMFDQPIISKQICSFDNEAITILKKIKYKEWERKKSLIQQSLEKYQTSITQMKDYLEWQNGCLNKILIQLNSLIEALKYELNQLKEPKIEDLIQKNLIIELRIKFI